MQDVPDDGVLALQHSLGAEADAAVFTPSVNGFQDAVVVWAELMATVAVAQPTGLRQRHDGNTDKYAFTSACGETAPSQLSNWVPPALYLLVAGLLRRRAEDDVRAKIAKKSPFDFSWRLLLWPEGWNDGWGFLVKRRDASACEEFSITGMPSQAAGGVLVSLSWLLLAQGEATALRILFQHVKAHLDRDLLSGMDLPTNKYQIRYSKFRFGSVEETVGTSVAATLMDIPTGCLQPHVVSALAAAAGCVLGARGVLEDNVDNELFYDPDYEAECIDDDGPEDLPVIARLEKHAALAAVDPARAEWLREVLRRRDDPDLDGLAARLEPRGVAWPRAVSCGDFGPGDVRAIVLRHAAVHSRSCMDGLLAALASAVGGSAERLDVAIGALSQELGLVEEAVALAGVVGVGSRRWAPLELAEMLQRAEWRLHGPSLEIYCCTGPSVTTPVASVFDDRGGGPRLFRKTPATTWLGRPRPHVLLHHLPGTTKPPWALPDAAVRATVDRETFVERWHGIVGDVLDDFPYWGTLMATGGAVARCLDPEPLPDTAEATLGTFDVDLFFVLSGNIDLKRYAAALERHIVQQAGGPAEVLSLLTEKSLTFVFSDLAKPRIRVDLGLWYSAGEFLAAVDVDCCCMAYNHAARQVYLSARGLWAWSHRLNVALAGRAEARGARSYRMRLWKYAARHGIAVLDPRSSGTDRRLWERGHRLSAEERGKRPRAVTEGELEGLAWLLAVEEGRVVPVLRRSLLQPSTRVALDDIERLLTRPAGTLFFEPNAYGEDESPVMPVGRVERHPLDGTAELLASVRGLFEPFRHTPAVTRDRLEQRVSAFRPRIEISAEELESKGRQRIAAAAREVTWSLDFFGPPGSTDSRAAFENARRLQRGHRAEGQ